MDHNAFFVLSVILPNRRREETKRMEALEVRLLGMQETGRL